jgi:hypothetical protein
MVCIWFVLIVGIYCCGKGRLCQMILLSVLHPQLTHPITGGVITPRSQRFSGTSRELTDLFTATASDGKQT